MVESIKSYVVDASFLLSFLFPDERLPHLLHYFDDHKNEKVIFRAPALLPFEITNSLAVAVSRKRITLRNALDLLSRFSELIIYLDNVDFADALRISTKYNLSVYDSSYVHLSRARGIPLLTLDKKINTLVND